MTRSEASRDGLKRYFGKPCQRGHAGERYTSTGGCVMCVATRTKRQVDSGYFRTLYQGNHEAQRARFKRYYALKRESIIEGVKAWGRKNKTLVNATKKNYKAKRRAQEISGVSTAALLAWSNAQPKICHWCGCDCADSPHHDHYMPLSKGGAHELANLVISCRICNLRKNARQPNEFKTLLASGYYAKVNPEMLTEGEA